MYRHSNKDFLQLLKQKPLEDIETIRHIEKLLLRKRGFIFRMPSPKTQVIHLVSGGIDSIVTWAMLMHEHRLVVHPICINTGQKRHAWELKAVTYFSQLFQKLYPEYYIQPFNITFPSSAPEISTLLRGNLQKTIHPQVLRDNYDKEKNTIELTRQYLFPAFFPFPAALAALFFELRRNLKIRTIFCSILPTDGSYNSSQTLTAIRSTTLALCSYTNDYSWQVASRCFEKETGFVLDKSDLIRWAHEHNIPIEKTYTCLKGKAYHCGDCMACGFRKKQFQEAEVLDKTIYINEKNRQVNLAVSRLKHILKPIIAIPKRLLKKLARSPKIFIKDFY